MSSHMDRRNKERVLFMLEEAERHLSLARIVLFYDEGHGDGVHDELREKVREMEEKLQVLIPLVRSQPASL